jgi:hypothetical protein
MALYPINRGDTQATSGASGLYSSPNWTMDDVLEASQNATTVLSVATKRVPVTIRPAVETSATSSSDGEITAGIRQFIDTIYALDERDPDDAIDVLVDRLDDLQKAGRFDDVEAILYGLKPARLTAPTIVSVLGITLATRRILDGRRVFFRLALKAIAQQRGSDEAAAKLLNKYR